MGRTCGRITYGRWKNYSHFLETSVHSAVLGYFLSLAPWKCFDLGGQEDVLNEQQQLAHILARAAFHCYGMCTRGQLYCHWVYPGFVAAFMSTNATDIAWASASMRRSHDTWDALSKSSVAFWKPAIKQSPHNNTFVKETFELLQANVFHGSR